MEGISGCRLALFERRSNRGIVQDINSKESLCSEPRTEGFFETLFKPGDGLFTFDTLRTTLWRNPRTHRPRRS